MSPTIVPDKKSSDNLAAKGALAMNGLSNSVNGVWLFLLLATAVTFGMGESGFSDTGRGLAVLVMFSLAFAKGLSVILYFMELRHAPLLWRLLLVGWLVVVVAGILLAWWAGAR